MEIILDALLDSVKLLPFLFLTYLFMELLEHRVASGSRIRLRTAGRMGPVWGAALGILPQCGFSAAASNLYAGRVITVGTLMAVYLSTSDEMIPILVSESVAVGTIVKILAVKAVIAAVTGLALEYFFRNVKKTRTEHDIFMADEEGHCGCGNHMLLSAIWHTVKIFIYIFLISLVLNFCIETIGEDALASLFVELPIVGEMLVALVGLIPNCASSVVITELYLKGILGSGAMMAGLLVNAGIGLLVLVRLNRDWKQNLKIIGILYGVGVFWGSVIELAGVVF